MKRALFFSAACAALIGAALMIAVLIFSDEAVRRGLTISAVVAFAVQVIAFVIVRAMTVTRRMNVFAGWGIGVVMRFAALFLFALVAVPRLGVPLGASLLGLAVFLFVSTLIEPLFLKS